MVSKLFAESPGKARSLDNYFKWVLMMYGPEFQGAEYYRAGATADGDGEHLQGVEGGMAGMSCV